MPQKNKDEIYVAITEQVYDRRHLKKTCRRKSHKTKMPKKKYPDNIKENYNEFLKKFSTSFLSTFTNRLQKGHIIRRFLK